MIVPSPLVSISPHRNLAALQGRIANCTIRDAATHNAGSFSALSLYQAIVFRRKASGGVYRRLRNSFSDLAMLPNMAATGYLFAHIFSQPIWPKHYEPERACFQADTLARHCCSAGYLLQNSVTQASIISCVKFIQARIILSCSGAGYSLKFTGIIFHRRRLWFAFRCILSGGDRPIGL